VKKPSLLMADDHRIVIEGLRNILTAHFNLVGEASTGRELVARAEQLKPDLVVVDISMPEVNGIEAVHMLKVLGNPALVVFLTMHTEPAYVARALEVGARGYVLKHSASEELVEALQTVLAGGTFLSPRLKTLESSPNTERVPRRSASSGTALTSRQEEVLRLLAEGKSARESGAILGISPRTIETHKYKIMDELGLQSSAELIQYAIRMGLVGKR